MFDAQYKLTLSETGEIRYRTETDTWTDEEGNSHTDTYQVPYEYYILTVNLKNRTLPVVINDRRPKGALFGYHVDEGQQALSVG